MLIFALRKIYMKQFFSILPVSIVVLLITVFSIVPHHHHKEVLCMVMEMCEQDNTYNDQHTEHETSPEEADCDNGCVVSALYTAPSNVLNGDSVIDGNHDFLVKSFCLLTSYVLYIPQFSIIPKTYLSYVISYESAPLGLSCGLRAPPSYLS